ncbi:hypothetical protein BH11MYX1_BH11MYX1_52170 [soil metagenome]
MIFADAVIVFVGVAGGHHEAVERQIAPLLDHVGVNELAIPAPDLAAIVRHTDASRDVVKNLHVDGVLGGALITANGQQTFRFVIYDGNGNMRSLGETPLNGPTLSTSDLEMLGINLGEEVSSLQATNKPPARVPPPAAIATSAPPSSPKQPEAPAPVAPGPAAPTQVANADAVSVADIEAMTGGGSSAAVADVTTTVEPPTATLRLHVDAGVGMTGRVFAAPTGVTGYTSTPVGTVHVGAGVAPTERTSIELAAERTISMSTALDAGRASTSISRWQVDGGYAVLEGDTTIIASLGVGNRAFSIDAVTSGGRTPDSEYNYLALGARVAHTIGSRVTVRGRVEFEPVFGGVDGMAMALGTASRWGLDVGAALDLALIHHLAARAAFDYQRFAWSWAAASSAADSYPTATVALRSEF